MVLYDASAMVRSLLAHLLKPYLTLSSMGYWPLLSNLPLIQSRFHNAQYLHRESEAPCGGLTGGAGLLPVERPSRKKIPRFFHLVHSIAYL